MASLKRQIERWEKLKQPLITLLTCPLCSYNDSIQKYEKLEANDLFNAGKIIRYKCPECDLIFGDLRFLNLTNEEIDNDYSDLYSYYEEGNTTPYILNYLNSLELFKNKEFKYLDYACGNGDTVVELRKKNYNVYGYDKCIRKNNDLIFNNIDGKKFDVIYSHNYIEHLINPIDDITKILKNLNPNGYLIFSSECLEIYKYEITHYHTFFFIGRSFELLCKKLNLEIVESKIVDSCQIKVLKKL